MKILVSDPISDIGLSILKEAHFNVVYIPKPTEKDIINACRDINGWIIRSGTKITESLLEKAEKLVVIGRAGVGVDNVDLKAATYKGVIVMNTPDVNTISAAEHTVAMMLALSRNIPLGHSAIQRGEWNRQALVGTELKNKILGVVGIGKIGREVISRCRSFGMKILGYDPYVGQENFDIELVRCVNLESLITESDYISIHVPLFDSTRNLFNYSNLCRLKPSARIINVARGGIINEEDLAQVLNENKIAGAAIDVFTQEPVDFNHPLIHAKNIVLTPHLGASTKEANEGVSQAICEQIRDFLLHEKLINAVNMPIADLAKMKKIQPHLELAEIMGKLQDQLIVGNIKKVQVECSGTIEDNKPIALAFIKGLLGRRVPERVNFVNAETLAVNLGIKIEHSYSSDSGAYTNLIRSKISNGKTSYEIHGSVFEGKRMRLVNILGYEMDLNPKGIMLFTTNKDVPGVIGKVGTTLGKNNVNIGGYLLSRDKNNGEAFAVIRVDNAVTDKVLSLLQAIPEITSIKQIHC